MGPAGARLIVEGMVCGTVTVEHFRRRTLIGFVSAAPASGRERAFGLPWGGRLSRHLCRQLARLHQTLLRCTFLPDSKLGLGSAACCARCCCSGCPRRAPTTTWSRTRPFARAPRSRVHRRPSTPPAPPPPPADTTVVYSSVLAKARLSELAARMESQPREGAAGLDAHPALGRGRRTHAGGEIERLDERLLPRDAVATGLPRAVRRPSSAPPRTGARSSSRSSTTARRTTRASRSSVASARGTSSWTKTQYADEIERTAQTLMRALQPDRRHDPLVELRAVGATRRSSTI